MKLLYNIGQNSLFWLMFICASDNLPMVSLNITISQAGFRPDQTVIFQMDHNIWCFTVAYFYQESSHFFHRQDTKSAVIYRLKKKAMVGFFGKNML